jgi:hypothetical protein
VHLNTKSPRSGPQNSVHLGRVDCISQNQAQEFGEFEKYFFKCIIVDNAIIVLQKAKSAFARHLQDECKIGKQ